MTSNSNIYSVFRNSSLLTKVTNLIDFGFLSKGAETMYTIH